jgi:hypothetical protein
MRKARSSREGACSPNTHIKAITMTRILLVGVGSHVLAKALADLRIERVVASSRRRAARCRRIRSSPIRWLISIILSKPLSGGRWTA